MPSTAPYGCPWQASGSASVAFPLFDRLAGCIQVLTGDHGVSKREVSGHVPVEVLFWDALAASPTPPAEDDGQFAHFRIMSILKPLQPAVSMGNSPQSLSGTLECGAVKRPWRVCCVRLYAARGQKLSSGRR